MTILVVFGGVTTEHDVSIVTAVQAMGAMSDDYDVVPVYIGSDGVWRYSRGFNTVDAVKKCKRALTVCFHPASPFLWHGKRKIAKIDCILSCMHGLHGEDGAIPALAESAGLPYSCCGIAASAVGMDKILSKYFFRGIGLNNVSGISVRHGEVPTAAVQDAGLQYPLVVKPARLGSSIGIAMAHDEEELKQAVEVALGYDSRVLIEEGVMERREFNCAALGHDGRCTVGDVEEVGGLDELLSFTDKYLRGGKIKGMDNLARKVPAQISEKLRKQIEKATKKIFAALDMRGVVRVDFLYDTAAKSLYVNEVNIVPGSLAYYLFPDLGMKGVIKTLIQDACAAHRRSQLLITTFSQEIVHPK